MAEYCVPAFCSMIYAILVAAIVVFLYKRGIADIGKITARPLDLNEDASKQPSAPSRE